MRNTLRRTGVMAAIAILATMGAVSTASADDGHYLSGSDVVAGSGCKAWMNGRGHGNGFQVQGRVESWLRWGSCTMWLEQRRDGERNYHPISSKISVSGWADQDWSAFYPDGSHLNTRVCVKFGGDFAQCSKSF
ncbi:hypothetical protein [Kitasatospora aureofaciens]